MSGKGFGVVGREGARRGGFARLTSVAVVGVVGLGLVGGLSACSSDSSTTPVAQSTPLTPTVTVTSTRPAAPSSTAAPAPSVATRTSVPATTTHPTSTVAPVSRTSTAPTLDPALVGTWDVHDSMITVRADGTGTLRSWFGCAQKGVEVCWLTSPVRVTPYGVSGARLTVLATYAEDSTGHLSPVPAGIDPAEGKQAVGDYSVLQPFTAATWPYAGAPYGTPITATRQRDVYSWLSASRGQALGDPKDEFARMCRTVGAPPRALDPTYCGA